MYSLDLIFCFFNILILNVKIGNFKEWKVVF